LRTGSGRGEGVGLAAALRAPFGPAATVRTGPYAGQQFWGRPRFPAYRADGRYWQDIGSPEKLEAARKRLAGLGSNDQ